MGELGNLFVLYLITEEALIDDFLPLYSLVDILL